METANPNTPTAASVQKRKKLSWSIIYRQRYLFAMSLPLVIWLIIFAYTPIWGWTMAFQNYRPGRAFLDQPWVGLKNFIDLFHDQRFYMVLRNTLAMSLMSLVVGYTIPIIFAILLNEIRKMAFKRTIQTVSYLPHFVSWVIVAGLFAKMLSVDGGIINQILVSLHLVDKPIQFMAKGNLFWFIVTAADAWKETGWNSIIYLAAIAGIDAELYEAATVDGAGRLRKMWHITLPGIRPTIMVMLIMSIGWLISIGFEKQYLMGNSMVKDYSEVLDLYVLNYGINVARYSFGTAVGIFNSLVSIILLFLSNSIFKRVTNESVI